MQSAYVQWFQGDSWIEVTGHVFYQGALATTTLVRQRAGIGGTRARARCEPGFLPGLTAVAALSGA